MKKRRGFNRRGIKTRENNRGESDQSTPYMCMELFKKKISSVVYMDGSAENTDEKGLINYKLKVSTISLYRSSETPARMLSNESTHLCSDRRD